MYPVVFQAFKSTLGNEGGTNWMYLDSGGLVHTGWGNLIDSVADAQALRWYLPSGQQATDAQVADQWNLVKSWQSHSVDGGMAFRNFDGNDLRMSWADVDALVASKAQQMAATLERKLPAIRAFPADAQLGILRWAWANGAAAWTDGPSPFPRMYDALNQVVPNFDVAADESQWKGENFSVKVLIDQLFHNATDVIAQGLDPTVLLYPNSVTVAPYKPQGRVGMSVVFGTGLAMAAGGVLLYTGYQALSKVRTPAGAT